MTMEREQNRERKSSGGIVRGNMPGA